MSTVIPIGTGMESWLQRASDEDTKRRDLIDQLKALHQQYDPNGRFIYDHLMRPTYPLADLERLIAGASPAGPPILTGEVHDITPSYDKLCAMFPDGFGGFDEAQYTVWVREKVAKRGAYYYAREKDSFFEWEAYEIAARMGRNTLIMENLS